MVVTIENKAKGLELAKQLVNQKEEAIFQIYSGLDDHCRCGCGGKYYEDKISRGWKIVKTKINNLTEEDLLPESDTVKDIISINYNYCNKESYINISLLNNKAYTIYYNEDKVDGIDKEFKS